MVAQGNLLDAYSWELKIKGDVRFKICLEFQIFAVSRYLFVDFDGGVRARSEPRHIFALEILDLFSILGFKPILSKGQTSLHEPTREVFNFKKPTHSGKIRVDCKIFALDVRVSNLDRVINCEPFVFGHAIIVLGFSQVP